LIKSCKWR